MITFSIELDQCDLEMAMIKAKNEAYNKFYRWDFTITLLNVSMICGEENDSYIFNFQVIN